MRIGHCQLDSQLGDFKGNLGKVLEGLKKADADRVDIVCFPECFLTGYPDDGEIARRDAFSIGSPQIMQLLDQTAKFEAAFIVATAALAWLVKVLERWCLGQRGPRMGTWPQTQRGASVKCKPLLPQESGKHHGVGRGRSGRPRPSVGGSG